MSDKQSIVSTKRHVVINEFGGPEKLRVTEMATQLQPGPGQLLIDVEAAGVNYLDVMRRNGAHGATLPFIPGMEGVGHIREIGDGITGTLAVGQRVAWVDAPGSYASQVLVRAERAIAISEALSVTESLLFQALTAQYLVSEYRHIRPGDRVLVHSAAGGVGQLLVQWLKHLEAWVVGTTANEQKAQTARAIGADAVIVYGRDYSFVEELKTLTSGRGVDLAFDAVGQATLQNTLRSLARGGMAVSYGSASGPPPSIDPLELVFPCTRLAGGAVFTYIEDSAELQRRASAIVDAIGEGWLHVPEGRAYNLDDVQAAHRDLGSRSTQGKLYLVF